MSLLCHGTTKLNKQCKGRGQLNGFCRMHQSQLGDGIISDAYDAVKRRVKSVLKGVVASDKPSSRLQKFMDENPSQIVKIEACRKPLAQPVRKALDAVSFGQFSKRSKKLKYDEVYHSYLLITTADGKVTKIEKNHIVEESAAKASDGNYQKLDIPLNGKSLTIKDMITTASAGKEKDFYNYTSGDQNCQVFMRDMVERNGLMPTDLPPELEIQNAHELVSAVPGGTHTANAVTDTAAYLDRIVHGDGMRKLRYRLK